MEGERFRGLREEYEAAGRAAHYSSDRWEGTRHARRTDARERRIVAAWLRRCGRIERALDLPCGAGRFHSLLQESARVVISADAARPMLVRHPGAARLQASAHALPLRDGCAEFALCSRLLHHLGAAEERRLVLCELARVSRRWAVVSHFDRASLQALRSRLCGRSDGRLALSVAAFRAEVAACGWIERERAWVLRGFSEQTWVLLEKAGP